MDNEFMNECIGQKRLKSQCEIFKKSFEISSVLPFFFFTAARGYGKTHFARALAKELVDPQGRERPLIEVNAASIKTVDSFVQIWYPKMRDNNALLFIDEAHELKPKLQSLLLTICEKSKNPVRRVRYEDREVGEVELTFDFRDYAMVFATTDHQKMVGPLKDRLTQLTIAQYSNDELWDIFLMHIDCLISEDLKEEIVSVFRGHPRSCVEMADKLDHFSAATGNGYINQSVWDQFRATMGIFDFGLNDTEMHILQIIGRDGPQALLDLAAKTELDKKVIQQEYELLLKKKNLLSVDGKRRLTDAGHKFYRKEFC